MTKQGANFSCQNIIHQERMDRMRRWLMVKRNGPGRIGSRNSGIRREPCAKEARDRMPVIDLIEKANMGMVNIVADTSITKIAYLADLLRMFIKVLSQFLLSTRTTKTCILYDILNDVLGNELLHFTKSSAFPGVVRTHENDDLIFIERENVTVGERNGLK